MDREQADSVFEVLTAERKKAHAAAKQRREQDARAVARQKRLAFAAFLGFALGALLGYTQYGYWYLPGFLGAGFGLIVGSVLHRRKL